MIKVKIVYFIVRIEVCIYFVSLDNFSVEENQNYFCFFTMKFHVIDVLELVPWKKDTKIIENIKINSTMWVLFYRVQFNKKALIDFCFSLFQLTGLVLNTVRMHLSITIKRKSKIEIKKKKHYKVS